MKNTIVFVQMYGGKGSTGSGGGLVSQETLAKYLIEKNFNVYAITNPSDKYGFNFLKDKRLIAHFKDSNNTAINTFLFNYKLLKNELFRIIKDLPKNSIFISVDPFPQDVIAAYYIKHKLKRNVIITMHHITPSIFFHPFRRGVLRLFIAWSISIFALYIIKTQSIPVFLDNKRIAKETGWNLNNLLMEMPLSTESNIMPLKNKNGFVACFIGRPTKNKGIIDLILSWMYVIKSIPSAQLYIIGNDSGNKKYHKLIDKFNLTGSIIITGFLDKNDKNEIMSRSKLFVFPSYEEGWSLAVMEAINSGLLPIIYNIPAYDYVCNSDIKVKPGDIKNFANKIIYFFQNEVKTNDLILQLQECNKKYSTEYVYNIWINQIYEKFKFNV